MSDLIRFNIRISPEVHEWYMSESKRTGASMSSLMFMALEKQMQERRFLGGQMPQIVDMAEKLGQIPPEKAEALKVLLKQANK